MAKRMSRRADAGQRAGQRAWCLLVLGVLVLVGCGAADQDDDAPVAGQQNAGAFPVTIEHKYGSTAVEDRPERIVTVGLMDQDALLALGIAPVATTEWFGEQPGAIWPWAEDELDAIGAELPEVVGDATEVNFEAVAAQEPDLILALYSGISEEDYQKLSEIAPTVAQPADHVDYGVPWEDLTRTVGRAVGQADQADALIEDIEAEFAAVQAEHPEFDGATAVMATPYEGIFVYGPDDPRGRFLSALGFELPSGLADVTGDEFGANLSEERVELLNVDAIVWLDAGDAKDSIGGPLYQSLAVHTEGREVFLDSFADPLGAATSFVTVLSLEYLLEGIAPQLSAAVDGDPATASG